MVKSLITYGNLTPVRFDYKLTSFKTTVNLWSEDENEYLARTKIAYILQVHHQWTMTRFACKFKSLQILLHNRGSILRLHP